jgi:transposase-like protein
LPEMVKAVLERGLATELTEHLGYEKGDPAGRGVSPATAMGPPVCQKVGTTSRSRAVC